jgi:branched-subunit amino acid ABC-type transport system permease component
MFDILPQLLVNAVITGSIYALASSGLALTVGLLRILNFAHGHIMMTGAYIFFFFHVQQEYALLTAGAASIVVTALLGLLTLTIFITPFLKSSTLLPFVTTIALGSILEAAVSLGFGVNVRSFPTGSGVESLQLGSIFITPIQLLIIASALTILGILGVVIHLTPFGRKVRALAENQHAAEGLGISGKHITLGIFILSMLLGAYAGVLVGYETNIQPTMGGSYTMKAFAAMILGGLGNVWGTIAGAYILGLVENLSIGLDFGGYSLPAGYKDAFAFAIILVVLLCRPQGLFGAKARIT